MSENQIFSEGSRAFASDKRIGLVENLAGFYPDALWQFCVVHFNRNVWTAVATGKVKEAAATLTAIHAMTMPRLRISSRTVLAKRRVAKHAARTLLLPEGQ